MTTFCMIILLSGKVDIDFGGKLGIAYRHVAGTSFGLQGLMLDCASINLDANLASKFSARMEADFSDGVNLKTARIRYDPFEFLSLRIGQQQIPFSRSKMISFIKRDFLEHTWGNKWADKEGYEGRDMGIILKGKVELGGKFRLIPLTSVFVSSRDMFSAASRIAFKYRGHEIALAYSTRGGLFKTDSMLWTAGLHLDFPVSCDIEALFGPTMHSVSSSASCMLLDNRLKPSLRFEWFDDTDDLDPAAQDITIGLSWLMKEAMLFQAEFVFPVVKGATPIRIIAGIKVNL